jgi:hypothetical protein
MNNEAFANLTKTQQLYVESIRDIGGNQLGYDMTKTNWTRKELIAVSMIRQNNDDVPNWIVKDQSRRVSRGVYNIPEVVVDASPAQDVVEDGLPEDMSICDDMDPNIYVSDDMIVGVSNDSF